MVETRYPHGRPRELSDSLIWFPADDQNEKVRTSFGELIIEEKPPSSLWASRFASVNELGLDQLRELLSSEDSRRVLERLAEDMDIECRFSLALLLTATPAQLMSESLRDRLGVYESDDQTQILPHNDEWYLCVSSEARLKEVMTEGKTVLVNNTLLVKNEGYMTGICVENRSTATGTFLKGVWYSPVEKATKKAIEKAFQHGPEIGKTDLTLDGGNWALMRDVTSTYPGFEYLQFMQSVEDYVFSQ